MSASDEWKEIGTVPYVHIAHGSIMTHVHTSMIHMAVIHHETSADPNGIEVLPEVELK